MVIITYAFQDVSSVNKFLPFYISPPRLFNAALPINFIYHIGARLRNHNLTLLLGRETLLLNINQIENDESESRFSVLRILSFVLDIAD